MIPARLTQIDVIKLTQALGQLKTEEMTFKGIQNFCKEVIGKSPNRDTLRKILTSLGKKYSDSRKPIGERRGLKELVLHLYKETGCKLPEWYA